MLGSGFGRTDFPLIFIFGPPDFFADFLAGFFLLIFVGKSDQKKILQENPRRNPPKFIQQKSSDTFLQNGRGKNGHFPLRRVGKSHVAGSRKLGLTNLCAFGLQGFRITLVLQEHRADSQGELKVTDLR